MKYFEINNILPILGVVYMFKSLESEVSITSN